MTYDQPSSWEKVQELMSVTCSSGLQGPRVNLCVSVAGSLNPKHQYHLNPTGQEAVLVYKLLEKHCLQAEPRDIPFLAVWRISLFPEVISSDALVTVTDLASRPHTESQCWCTPALQARKLTLHQGHQILTM